MSTYKQKYNKKYSYPPGTSHSLDDIAKKTGHRREGLQEIFEKGVGAYKTNPASVRPQVKSAEHWAYARVYAAIDPTSKAHKYDRAHLYPLYEPFKSTKQYKKYDVVVKTPSGGRRIISYGDNRYEHFKDRTKAKAWAHLDHNDPKRKKRYYQRHAQTDNKDTARYWANKTLW